MRAEILGWRGLSKDALALLQEELPASLSHDEVAVRRKLAQSLANFYLQRYDESKQQLAEAEHLAQNYQPALLGYVALNQGTVAVFQDKYPIAETYFRRALQIAQSQGNRFQEANALGSLGLTSMRRRQYDAAVDWYRESLSISEALQNRIQIEKTSGNLGWSYYKLGDFENALSLFKKAAAICSDLGLAKDQQIWLSNSGVIYFAEGNFEEAERNYLAALAMAQKLENRALTAITLNDLAQLELERGKISEAQVYSNRALELSQANSLRTSEFYALLNNARIMVAQGKYSEARLGFRYLLSQKDADLSLRWEAEASIADVYKRLGQTTSADTLFRTSISTIDQARSSLASTESRLSFLNTAAAFYNSYIDFLISRKRVDEALAVAEHSRARTLAEGLGIKPASLESKNLDARELARRQHAVILAYWLKPERSYLWAITPEKISLFTLPSDTEINAAVQEYRKALTGPRDPLETANAAGQQLYKMLVTPAEKLIPANSRVVIIADGSLYGLNFETLLAPSPKLHYWIDDITISNANSLAMLRSAGSPARHAAEGNLLLIGDPVSTSTEFPPLPAAKDEIREVSTHFPADRETVIDGPKATPAAYLDSDPSRFSYIHFVAHGTASRLSPLDSAVILSPQGDSNKLYARDIVEKPLRADLVTISACYGTGSRSYSGEGLVGLSWAFLRAGARNVIAALWEANDVSTPKLMDTMYAGIGKGNDPAAALRQAKLSLLRSDSVYRRPFYWGPFQLYVGPGRAKELTPRIERLTASKTGAARSR